MYSYGITGSSIGEFQDVDLTGLGDEDLLQYDSATGKWVAVAATSVGTTTLDGLSDVITTGAQDHDLLQYDDATNTWLAVSPGTVASDINLTNLNDVNIDGPSLGSEPFLKFNGGTAQWENVAIPVNDLSDVNITEAVEWPGPAPILFGSGAPSAGTGVNGDFYLDIAGAPSVYVLYGPKTAGAWALTGTSGTFGTDFVFGTQLPVGPNPGTSPAPYHLYTPSGTPLGVYGPYNADGLSTRTPLVYNPVNSAWENNTGRFLIDTNGGGSKISSQSVSGNVFIFPEIASEFFVTMTGNVTLAPTATGGLFGPVRQTNNQRAANIRIHLIQDGTGGRTVTAWPSNITWQHGVTPSLNTAANARTSFEFTTTDNGNNWFGRAISQTARTTDSNTFNVGQTVVSGATGTIAFTVRGVSGQTANLFVVESHDGTDRFVVNNDGYTTTANVQADGGVRVGAGSYTTNQRWVSLANAASVPSTATNSVIYYAEAGEARVRTPLANVGLTAKRVTIKTAAHTFEGADQGAVVVLNSGSNYDFTIPLNSTTAFPIGTEITVATQSTGHATIVGASGVTVTGTTVLNTAGQIARLIKIDTDTWLTHH